MSGEKKMADYITPQELISAKLDAKSLEDFINGNVNATIITRLNAIYPSLAKVIQILMQTGGWNAYTTEVELLATIPAVPRSTAYAFDTKKMYLWNGTSWSDEGLSQLDQAIVEAKKLDVEGLNNIKNISLSLQQLVTIILALDHSQQTLVNDFTAKKQDIAQSKNDLNYLGLALQQMILTQFETSQQQDLKRIQVNHDIQNQLVQFMLAQQALTSELAMNKAKGTATADAEAAYANHYVFGKPNGLILINFETTELPLPTSKGTVLKGQVTFNIDGQILHCYSTFEVQGSGSAAYPKKNWTFALYKDAEMTNDIDMSIANTVLQQEWVFKANYTDKAQVRNLLNYNLWEKFLNSRKGNFPIKDVDFSYLDLTGDVVQTNATTFPTGFNCVLNINGSFYGIGQLMTGKKRENFNIAKNSPKQILIGLDNLPGFRIDTLPVDSYELRAPSKPTAATNACLDAWRTFAQSSQADFTAKKSTFFHPQNVVDFYIYSQFIGNIDGITNNTMFISWNGAKWFFLPYDMDLTFKDFRMSADETNVFSYGNDNLEFWNKVRIAFKTEIATRWLELKAANITTVQSMRQMYLDITNQFTPALHTAELALYPNRETLSPYGGGEISTFNLQGFSDWVARRMVYCDSKFI